MKISNDNFINISSCVDETIPNKEIPAREMCHDIDIYSLHDPLNGAGNDEKNKFYRLDDVVFAEPLKSVINVKNSVTDTSKDEQITLIDNIMVKKRAGRKNKKYYVDFEDTTNPTCPQTNCTRSFSTITLLKAHIRKVHCSDRSRYICEECGAGFPAEYLRRRHALTHEGSVVECPVCQKMLSARTNLTVHLRSHSNARPHACRACDKTFKRKSTLDVHVKFVHRHGDLKCEKCDTRFTSRMEWSRHNTFHKTNAS